MASVEINSLSESEFHTWKRKIIIMLAVYELDQYIVEIALEFEHESNKTWIKSDRKDRAFIGLSLSGEHMEHVSDASTAKAMWNALRNVFDRHTLLNRLPARSRFRTVRMHPGENTLPYLNRVKQLAGALKSMNCNVDDNKIAKAALNCVPTSSDHLVLALDAHSNDDKLFKFDFVKNRLLQEQ